MNDGCFKKGHKTWNKGLKLSLAYRKKLSEAHKGIFPSLETRRKLSLSRIGNKNSLGFIHSKETRNKRRLIMLNNKYRLGKKSSIETCKKISVSNLGRVVSLETRLKIGKANKGKPSWRKGVPCSDVTKERISKTKIGENNPCWLGGIAKRPYSHEFNNRLKLKIRARDNFTCQECKMTEKELNRVNQVHHIDYNKQNNSENNLISLCISCHHQTNFKRDDWVDYFKEKLLDA